MSKEQQPIRHPRTYRHLGQLILKLVSHTTSSLKQLLRSNDGQAKEVH